jgi:hypothetical protein
MIPISCPVDMILNEIKKSKRGYTGFIKDSLTFYVVIYGIESRCEGFAV